MGILRPRRGRSRRDLPIDRLEAPNASLDVTLLSDQSYSEDSECGTRRPHRHDYHELIWSRRGRGSHLIDGDRSELASNMVTVIGRGQVHVFERAEGLHGALVRFGDELLHVDAVARANPSWLVGFQGPHAVVVPRREVDGLDGLIRSLTEEAGRHADTNSLDVQRHLLCTLLLWVERWYDATRNGGQPGVRGAARRLYHDFVGVLERDYADHHDVRHYADELRVRPAALSRALAEVTGRSTKELITDRRMLEAARLLRYTDHSVGEVASRAGFDDQLYFSRAFKRYYGEAPTFYRERIRSR